jgi:hypothetical protein
MGNTNHPIAMPRVWVVHSFRRASFAARGLVSSSTAVSFFVEPAMLICFIFEQQPFPKIPSKKIWDTALYLSKTPNGTYP